MELIDTHVHFWSPDTHPWVTDKTHPANKFATVPSYLVDDYKKDVEGANVVGCVHVEAAWPGDPVGETIWVSEFADKTGIPNAIVGHADLSSANVEDVLKRQTDHKRIRGIRHVLNYHPDYPEYCIASHDNYFTDPDWIRGFSLLEKYNLSFELQIFPNQMSRAASVVRDHPGVRVMVDHCGNPFQTDVPAAMKQWEEGVVELSQCPNVFFKISGSFLSSEHWNSRSPAGTHPVETVLKILGIDRCVFGSNFPVDKINGSYQQLLDALEPILSLYSEDDQRKFYAGNARTFYRL